MTFEEIRKAAEAEWQGLENSPKPRILIGSATCGRASGALKVRDAIEVALTRHGIQATIMEVGCIGTCYVEPVINITKPGQPQVYYGNVTPDIGAQLVEDYLIN